MLLTCRLLFIAQLSEMSICSIKFDCTFTAFRAETIALFLYGGLESVFECYGFDQENLSIKKSARDVRKKVNHCLHFHNSGKQCRILAKFCNNNAKSNCKQNAKFQ